MNSARRQAAKRLLTAHIAHNYTWNKLYSTCSSDLCVFVFLENLKCTFGSAAHTPLAFDRNAARFAVITPEVCRINQNLSLIF